MPLYVEPRPNGIYYIRGTFQGVPVRRSAETKDRDTAEAVRALVEKEILAAKFDPEQAKRQRDRVSFTAGADHYLTHGKNAPHSPRTVAFVERLQDHFGALPIDRIGQDEIDDAVTAIVGNDAAPATKIRVVIGPTTAILRHNAKRGKCAVPDFELPAVGKSQTPFLTPREALALVGSAAAHLKPLLVFLFGTGARLSEALYLDWKDVDLTAGHARLGMHTDDGTKNGEVRIAALPPAVIVALANLDHRTGAIFRRDDGEPYAATEGEYGGQIKTGWKAACRRAGLIVEAVNPDGTPALAADGSRVWVARVSPHACRHSWATWFYAASRNLLLLKDEGGWKSDAMVTRYAKLMNVAHEADIALVWGGAHPRIGTEARPIHAQPAKASGE